MLENILPLDRPLVVFDTETTGTNPRSDRIVEIACVKIHPDGRRENWHRRVNPGIPIPSASTAIHGICDADVAGQPRFADVAAELGGVPRGLRPGRLQHHRLRPAGAADRVPAGGRVLRDQRPPPRGRPADLLRARAAAPDRRGALLLPVRSRRGARRARRRGDDAPGPRRPARALRGLAAVGRRAARASSARGSTRTSIRRAASGSSTASRRSISERTAAARSKT